MCIYIYKNILARPVDDPSTRTGGRASESAALRRPPRPLTWQRAIRIFLGKYTFLELSRGMPHDGV